MDNRNGLNLYKGVYHLFQIYNPQGITWGLYILGYPVKRKIVDECSETAVEDELATGEEIMFAERLRLFRMAASKGLVCQNAYDQVEKVVLNGMKSADADYSRVVNDPWRESYQKDRREEISNVKGDK